MTGPLLRRVARAAAALSVCAALVPDAGRAQGFVTCDPAPQPVMTLNYGSRYADGAAGRTVVDSESNQQVNAALKPVDDFLRSLTDMASGVHTASAAGAQAMADCALSQIATWAKANALADQRSVTSRLTVGARIAGFGMVLVQVLPHASNASREMIAIRPWLENLMAEQMFFWEADAPDGASRGNLRAWAALAGATAARVLDDPIIRGWAAWSTTYVLCTANPDGSLPQEMTRGRLALHYQLHAVAPLTSAAALLLRDGVDVSQRCGEALRRVVHFTLGDLDDGQQTFDITGVRQSFFDGSDRLEPFQIAWVESYLALTYDPAVNALADAYRPLIYSKLGGNQTELWKSVR